MRVPRHCHLRASFALQLAMVVTAAAMKITRDGKYTQVTVKINEDIPESQCAKLLANLKVLLTDTSAAVGEAASWKVWPGQFIIVVPRGWRETSCRAVFMAAAGLSRHAAPDLVIRRGLLHGDARPRTLQTGGCGAPGRVTRVPAPFVLQPAAGADKILAHEFFKLRFGVFDEHGFHGDPVYPDHYLRRSKVTLTAAADTDIAGEWREDGGSGAVCGGAVDSCSFVPANNTALSCSLGLARLGAGLAGAWRYCDQVAAGAPTPHSALCGGETVPAVILASQDLQQLTGGGRSRGAAPEIVTVQERAPRYVLLVETSASMSDNDDWRWINKALRKLLLRDLAAGVEVGLVTYSHTAAAQFPLTRVTERARPHLAVLVPDRYKLERGAAGACLLCGLTAALELLGPSKQDGRIVIITRGGAVSPREQLKVAEYAEYYQLRISSLLVTAASAPPQLAPYRHLASITGGRCSLAAGPGPVRRYRQISAALSAELEHGEVVIHETEVAGGATATTGQFVVDPGASQNVTFAIFVADSEDHFIRSVTFRQLDTGAVVGPCRALSTEHDTINMKTVSLGPRRAASALLTPGRWSYAVQWAGAGPEAAVVVTARPAPHSPRLRVTVWTEGGGAGGGAAVVTPRHPLSAHVMVERGGQPVLGAAVTLLVTLTSPHNSSTTQLPPLQLWDGGGGAADLVAEDGVYSRYLVRCPGPGLYTLGVAVAGAGGTVVAGAGQHPGQDCCGSSTLASRHAAPRTGAFSRLVAGAASVLVAEVAAGPGDRMPPARVGDLRAARLPSGGVRLVFTAPGGDWDQGRAQQWLVLRDTDRARLGAAWHHTQVLATLPARHEAGATVEEEVEVTLRGSDLYLAVVAVDAAGNAGPVSNIVQCADTRGPARTSPSTALAADSGTSGGEAGGGAWGLVLGLCCGLLLTSLCLVTAVFYFLRCSGPRQPVMVDIGVSEDVTEPDTASSCSEEIRGMTTEFPLLVGVAALHCPAPATPTYWSASALLGEEEGGSCSRPGTLTPIREEYLGHFSEAGEAELHQYTEISDPGLANLAYTSTPLRRPPPPPPPVADMAAMDSCSDSAASSGGGEEAGPAVFSLGVQTVAPSCLAAIRHTTQLAQQQKHSSLV